MVDSMVVVLKCLSKFKTRGYLVFDFLIVDVILGIRCRIWQQSYLASTVAFKTLLSDKQCLSNTY